MFQSKGAADKPKRRTAAKMVKGIRRGKGIWD
jgi:hypothetical protein